MPDVKPEDNKPEATPEVVEVKPLGGNPRAELKKLESRRAELKAQTPEQAKNRDPKEYGRVKARIAELRAELD